MHRHPLARLALLVVTALGGLTPGLVTAPAAHAAPKPPPSSEVTEKDEALWSEPTQTSPAGRKLR